MLRELRLRHRCRLLTLGWLSDGCLEVSCHFVIWAAASVIIHDVDNSCGTILLCQFSWEAALLQLRGLLAQIQTLACPPQPFLL